MTTRRPAPLLRRHVHDLADRWTQAHAKVSWRTRLWPRPNSPLASLLTGDRPSSTSTQQATGADPKLPPVSGASSFAKYLEEVQRTDAGLGVCPPAVGAGAAQIHGEAARARARRRAPLPAAGRFDASEAPLLPHSPARVAAAAARGPAEEEASRAVEGLDRIAQFCMSPRQVKEHLDAHVVAQHAAKRALSVAVCDHYNFARACVDAPELAETHHVKPIILLLGPSGVGKPHLMRALSKLLGVPFVRADATKFSATGYVGDDVEDLVRSLVPAAGGDVATAEFGIIYIDEVDKLAEAGGRGRGSSGVGGINTRDVQCALLKLMEDGEVSLRRNGAAAEPPRVAWASGGAAARAAQRPAVVRTRHVLFVFSGAFTELEREMQKAREKARQAEAAEAAAAEAGAEGAGGGAAEGGSADAILREIGSEIARAGGATDATGATGATEPAADAGGDVLQSDVLHLAGTSDFVRGVLEPEFIGRIPVRVACSSLTAADLERVLTDPRDSISSQLERDFAGYGIELELTEQARAEVARRAVAERTGARGLLTVLEEALRDFKFELPGTSVERLVVDAETIRRPQQALEALLQDESAAR